MSERRYYSQRKHGSAVDLPMLKDLFLALCSSLRKRHYFDESMGYDCFEAAQQWVPGTMGRDVREFLFLALRKRNVYPFVQHCASWSEEDLFDVIEFLHDHVSEPVEGEYHDHCGWHYSVFDTDAGRAVYQADMNTVLADYGPGYRLSTEGEILEKGDAHLQTLLESPLPNCDPANVDKRVEAAVHTFLRYRASPADRLDAVRSLADVLEFLRPSLTPGMLTKDEADLFNIANNFGIRHHNRQQKTGYDARIWQTWMFYVYLATIHAVTRVLARPQTSDA